MIVVKNPAHPGEVLEELFLAPLGLSAGGLARRLGVPRTRIERLVKGRTSMTADTALRLAACFGNTAEFWMNLQDAYDLDAARARVDVTGIRPLDAA
jgi:addiction module HigA family antidote